DEIHTIMGAGAASGSLDAANILKPALARGEIRCVGATTYDEYKKHVENDPALERRFQPVQIAAPSPAETVEILRGLKPYYEQFHHVQITDEAVDAAVRFADRYITDRYFPDKAIDLVDEAAARLRVQTKNDPLLRRANAIEAALERSDADKRTAVIEERFDDATAVQKTHDELTREFGDIRKKLQHRKVVDVGAIGARDVAAVVAQMLHLPVDEILLEEHERLRRLGEELRQRIVGQDDAVAAIAKALQRAKSGLSSPQRPLASFLLLGPTGVGKTETAKALAELLFQSPDALIRLDMSEFSEGFTISKLIGAPAGYVGYREGSKLTDTIRKRPASVVLFDEIEKAHPDVWNLLLQILEDGRLTDATGRESRFTNAVIIMTSNVGAGAFTKAGIGFLEGASTHERLTKQYVDIRQDALKELKSKFRPELLNRIDETIIYRPLEREHLATIARMALAEFTARLQKEQKMTITADDTVYTWLAERAFDPAQGARAIRRLLHEHVENPVAAGILEERFVAGDTITINRPATGEVLDIQKFTPAKVRRVTRTTSRVRAR
ncbi:MAG: ATP-dependent Clp protease ATP-binding subunit, partial [bacterium]|nr:ATP-dependent Clp protease ATP-binding subunit [bacterium]